MAPQVAVACGSHSWLLHTFQSQGRYIFFGKEYVGICLYLHVFGCNRISRGCLKSPVQLLVGLSWFSDARPRGAEAEERERKQTNSFLLYRNQQDSFHIHFSASDHPQWPIYTSECVQSQSQWDLFHFRAKYRRLSFIHLFTFLILLYWNLACDVII